MSESGMFTISIGFLNSMHVLSIKQFTAIRLHYVLPELNDWNTVYKTGYFKYIFSIKILNDVKSSGVSAREIT